MIFLSVCKKITVIQLICTLFISTINSMDRQKNQPSENLLSFNALSDKAVAITEKPTNNADQAYYNSLYIGEKAPSISNNISFETRKLDIHPNCANLNNANLYNIVVNEIKNDPKLVAKTSPDSTTSYLASCSNLVSNERINNISCLIIKYSIMSALLDTNIAYWAKYKDDPNNVSNIYPMLTINYDEFLSIHANKKKADISIRAFESLTNSFPELSIHYKISNQTSLIDILTIALIYKNGKNDPTEENTLQLLSSIEKRRNYTAYKKLIQQVLDNVINNLNLSDYLAKNPNFIKEIGDQLSKFKQSRFKYIDDFFYYGSKIPLLNFLLKYFFTKHYKDIVTEESDKAV